MSRSLTHRRTTAWALAWSAALLYLGAAVPAQAAGRNAAGWMVSAHPVLLPGAGNEVAASLPAGSSPAGMALNPATGVLYVANSGGGTVSAISTSSGTLLATIPLGGMVALGGSPAPVGVGIDLAGNLVFVAETGAKRIAIIDGATNTLRGTLAADVGPWGVAVNQRTNTVYVTDLGGSVTVLDGLSGSVKAVIRDSRLGRPLGLAVAETINRVYIANRDGDSVVVLDGGANTVAAVIPVGSKPAAVAVDPTSGAVYVANSGASTLSRIDPGTNSVTATFTVGKGPVAVVVDPATGIVYAAAGDSTVTVLDGTGALLGSVADPSLSGPQGLLINTAAGQLYVSEGGGGSITTVPLTAAIAPNAPAT